MIPSRRVLTPPARLRIVKKQRQTVKKQRPINLDSIPGGYINIRISERSPLPEPRVLEIGKEVQP
jgi:hypothetical protein